MSLWDLTSSMGMTWAYPPPAAPPKQQSRPRLKRVTKFSYAGTWLPKPNRVACSPKAVRHEPFIQVEQSGKERWHCVQLCNLRTSVSLFQKKGTNNKRPCSKHEIILGIGQQIYVAVCHWSCTCTEVSKHFVKKHPADKLRLTHYKLPFILDNNIYDLPCCLSFKIINLLH